MPDKPKKPARSTRFVRMSWRRKTVWFTNRILIGISLIAYICAWISPKLFWPAAFIAYLIPLCLLANVVYLYVWYHKDWRYMLYSLGTLLLGLPFITASVSLSFRGGEPHSFSVFSFNTRVFNVYENDRGKDFSTSQKLVDAVMNDDSDIKCLQEFYMRKDSKVFNFRAAVKKQGKYELYISPQTPVKGQEFGLAILSKLPIIQSGEIVFSEKTRNGAIFADILVGKDTIRIINAHLESLHVREDHIVSTENIKGNSRNLFVQLKRAFVKRAQQIEELEKYVKDCPHRVIFCGDLNDVPYSYTYTKLSTWLDNAFESAGNGFGFTYNGKLIFLRIDHQFHSDGLRPTSLRSLRSVDHSDHFPVKGDYWIEER